jgi:hypothetical protein
MFRSAEHSWWFNILGNEYVCTSEVSLRITSRSRFWSDLRDRLHGRAATAGIVGKHHTCGAVGRLRFSWRDLQQSR